MRVARASGVNNLEEIHVTNHSTATAQVIPFRSAKLLLIEHEGQPFVPMKPVVEGMGLDWKTQYRKLQGGRFNTCMVIMTIQLQGDVQKREVACLPLKKLAGWLMSIHASKVRPELRDGVITYQNECDDALWAYWNEGHAVNHRGNGHAMTVLGQTIGTDGFHMLGALVKGKVSSLPAAVQRRATAKIWSQTHAAFGVRSAEDIPAGQLDSARNFIAAYTLEGEWLAKPEKAVGTVLTDHQLYNVYVACCCLTACYEVFKRHNLYVHLTGLGSRAAVEMLDHFKDGAMVAHWINRDFADEFDAVQRRLRVNQYGTRIQATN